MKGHRGFGASPRHKEPPPPPCRNLESYAASAPTRHHFSHEGPKVAKLDSHRRLQRHKQISIICLVDRLFGCNNHNWQHDNTHLCALSPSA